MPVDADIWAGIDMRKGDEVLMCSVYCADRYSYGRPTLPFYSQIFRTVLRHETSVSDNASSGKKRAAP